MYRYEGGKKELIELIFSGRNVRFEKISDTKIEYETYTSQDSISRNTYFFKNIYDWKTKKECLETLGMIEEHFDYIDIKK